MDLEYLLSGVSNLTGIPVRVYENNSLKHFCSIIKLPVDPISLYLNELNEIKAQVGYYMTPMFEYYGIINSDKTKIILGPSRLTPLGDDKLRELAFLCGVDNDDVQDFIFSMKSITSMRLDSLIQLLCILNYLINGVKLTLENITIYENEQKNISLDIEEERIKKNLSNYEDFSSENDLTHNTYTLEQNLMNIVQHGDSASLRALLSKLPAVNGGILSTEYLRQIQNTFIVTATLVSRSAIRGGMDPNDALSLSDAYIQKCEKLTEIDRISNLQYHMVLDYTEQVEKLRFGKSPSKLFLDISNYVSHHISDPVDIESLAKAVYLSRTHLASKFKKETGMTLSEYVIKEKINEGKRLLRYSNKSIISISEYLGFSSQSHFARTFKKYTNITPNEYREKHSIL